MLLCSSYPPTRQELHMCHSGTLSGFPSHVCVFHPPVTKQTPVDRQRYDHVI